MIDCVAADLLRQNDLLHRDDLLPIAARMTSRYLTLHETRRRACLIERLERDRQPYT